jgi:hypothetical protein
VFFGVRRGQIKKFIQCLAPFLVTPLPSNLLRSLPHKPNPNEPDRYYKQPGSETSGQAGEYGPWDPSDASGSKRTR